MEELAADYVNWLNRREWPLSLHFHTIHPVPFPHCFHTKPIIAILLVQGTAQWLTSKDAVAKPSWQEKTHAFSTLTSNPTP